MTLGLILCGQCTVQSCNHFFLHGLCLSSVPPMPAVICGCHCLQCFSVSPSEVAFCSSSVSAYTGSINIDFWSLHPDTAICPSVHASAFCLLKHAYGGCRATPQGTPGDPPHGASHSNVSRERPSRQGQTDHRAPQAAKPAEASVQDTKPGLHHRRARQDSRQASGDGKQSEAGSDQEGEPLVQYQDEGQPQYSNGYHGGEPEGQEYEAEGSVLQDAQQYEDEEGGQQYGSEDEQQAEAQAEDDEQQFEEEVQGVGGPSGRRSGSVGSAQDNAPDEWDIPAEGASHES